MGKRSGIVITMAQVTAGARVQSLARELFWSKKKKKREKEMLHLFLGRSLTSLELSAMSQSRSNGIIIRTTIYLFLFKVYLSH